MVGRPPWSARVPLDPLFVRRLAPPRPADEGVGRGPGGPPRGSAPPFLPHCTTVSATSAAANPGARTPEPHRLGEAAGERASDRHFDFVRRHSQRHAKLGPDSQAFADCIGDVRLSLSLCLPLADAARYRAALANVHAVFVLVDADNEFHAASILS